MSVETEAKLSAGRDPETLGQKGRERRLQIITAAKRRLISRGMDGLKLREIADEIQIAHGNLQYYFKTRDELLKAIYDEEAQVYTIKMRDFIGSASSPQAKLAAIIESGIMVLDSEETRLWRILFGLADQYPELADMLKRENDTYEAELVRQLNELNTQLPAARLAHIAQLIRIIMDGIGVGLLYNDSRSPEFIGLKNEILAMLNALLELK